LALERTKRQALEQEQARLHGAIARQNGRLAEVTDQYRLVQRQVQELLARVEAVVVQNAALAGEVATLREENARLRAEHRGGEQQGASVRRPPAFVKAKTEQPATKQPRRKRAAIHNRGRRRLAPEQVAHTVEHAVATCPHCATALTGGWAMRRVQVIDLPPPAPLAVTDHVLVTRRCPGCRRLVRPPGPGLADGRIGQSRFGPRLLAAITVMHTSERLPLAHITARLEREHGLRLSRGGLVGLLQLVARRARPQYQALREAVRQSPVVHADETGWRESGQHGYIWTFTTPTLRYFHRDPSRGGHVPDGVLGARFPGALVTDFYAAYDHLPGLHQRCWAHLWRDVEDLEGQYPDDQALAAWIAQLGAIWKKATGPRPTKEQGDAQPARRARAARARRYQEQVLALCPETLGADRPHATLAKRLRRYSDELFTFVRDPAVPPTNNLAERSLRSLVTARKISGGSRSSEGTETRMILASVLGTALVRNQDPLQACRLLLAAPVAQSP
jgi:transposase